MWEHLKEENAEFERRFSCIVLYPWVLSDDKVSKNKRNIQAYYFFVRTKSTIQFLIWFALTISGFVLTCVTTYLCYDVRHILHTVIVNTFFKDWADTPTSTSVAQIPIESVVFPAVTLCAITDTAEELSVQHVLGECSFTKNNQDTGYVCERVQVSLYASSFLHILYFITGNLQWIWPLSYI